LSGWLAAVPASNVVIISSELDHRFRVQLCKGCTLARKTYLGFNTLLHQALQAAQWFVKVDDDTVIPSLARYYEWLQLSRTHTRSEYVYAGACVGVPNGPDDEPRGCSDFINCSQLLPGPYAQGGLGIALSRASAERLERLYLRDACRELGIGKGLQTGRFSPEDLAVGQCLQRDQLPCSCLPTTNTWLPAAPLKELLRQAAAGRLVVAHGIKNPEMYAAFAKNSQLPTRYAVRYGR